jgi:hypothetical protein
VAVIFLNRELGRSPEAALLLPVQGLMAEYERAKILERHRRGQLHAARAGSINGLSGAPYGYRYVSKHAGGRTDTDGAHRVGAPRGLGDAEKSGLYGQRRLRQDAPRPTAPDAPGGPTEPPTAATAARLGR